MRTPEIHTQICKACAFSHWVIHFPQPLFHTHWYKSYKDVAGLYTKLLTLWVLSFNSIFPGLLRSKLTMGINSVLGCGCGIDTSDDGYDSFCHCRLVSLVGIWGWGGVCPGCFWTTDKSTFFLWLLWQHVAKPCIIAMTTDTIHILQPRWILDLDLLVEVFLSSFHLIWVDIHLYPYAGCKWSLPERDCSLNLFSCGRSIWSFLLSHWSFIGPLETLRHNLKAHADDMSLRFLRVHLSSGSENLTLDSWKELSRYYEAWL